MIAKPTLSRILADILDSRPMERPLSGGLMFQFREPDAEKSYYRLFCYRRGDIGPSATEYGVVRRELEQLLPGVEIALGCKEFRYRVSDGVCRTGKILGWSPVVAKQGALFSVPGAAVPGGYEE